MFLTAASSNHFKSAVQFLKSLNGAPVIFYDIGLTETEADVIKSMSVEYRLFDWTHIPSWGLLTSPNAGAYVWKSVIIHAVCQEPHDIVIWCDAGNIISDHRSLENHVNDVHLYTPGSSGTIQRWTHTTCIEGMGMKPEQIHYGMRNAAIIGFVLNDPVVKQFIDEWVMYCLKESLIVGSRDNHRHDQSILTCLFYKYNRLCSNYCIGFTIHNDCD